MIVKQHDSIMSILDKISKETNFVPIKSTHKTGDITRIFMKFILHKLHKVTVWDSDAKFTTNFLKGLFQDLGTQLYFNTSSYPQIDQKI